MKKIKFLFLFLTFTVILYSQPDDSFSYQAIVRDADQSVISNQEIGVLVKIIKNSIGNSASYEEYHNVTSNASGIITLLVGSGSSTSGFFSQLDWSTGRHYIATEIDPQGGKNYTISTVSEIMSVPYAQVAKTVINKDDADADPRNEIELPENPIQGSMAVFKDNSWTALQIGESDQVLSIVNGMPTWKNLYSIPIVPNCMDGLMNGSETGFDCGGPDCEPCGPPTCTDRLMNGSETGIDCGGPDCEPCPNYDLWLIGYSQTKLEIVKRVRALYGLTLQAAKELVEMAPVILSEDLTLSEANIQKTYFDGTDAILEIRIHE